MLLAGSGAFAPEDLGVRRHESAQKLGVFVIHISDFIFAEQAIFGKIGYGHGAIQMILIVHSNDSNNWHVIRLPVCLPVGKAGEAGRLELLMVKMEYPQR